MVGRSNIVGLPAALLLQNADATVTMVHSRTPNGQQICSQADIVIAACGKAGMVDASWVKEGATVIDVGINAVDVRSLKLDWWHLSSTGGSKALWQLAEGAELVGCKHHWSDRQHMCAWSTSGFWACSAELHSM